MSCGHDGCTCSPEPDSTDRQTLPRYQDQTAKKEHSGCCGEHDHHRLDDPEPATQHHGR